MNAGHHILAALTVASALACSPNSPTAPELPSVFGPWGSALSFSLTQLSTGQQVTGSCVIRLTIQEQSGVSFAGSFFRTWCSGAPLPLLAEGTLVDGVVRVDGGISFKLVPRDVDPAALIGVDCTTTSGDALFRGTLMGERFSATWDLTANCAGLGEVSGRYTLTMARP